MSSEILVITGPESSGKTTLASQLSDYCKNPLVPEVAKECLKEKLLTRNMTFYKLPSSSLILNSSDLKNSLLTVRPLYCLLVLVLC